MALSLATDLGFGQPPEHMVRSARLSLRLGERLGLSDDELAVLYDVSILTYVGCPIYGNEAAGRRFGAMLAKGASAPWQDALFELTGTRQMEASAILDYFAPLSGWLKEQNEGQKCGW